MNWYMCLAIGLSALILSAVVMSVIDTHREMQGKKPFMDMWL